MQSQRQYFSRLGTAFLRKSANSSRLSNSPAYSPPAHVLNTRRYLRIRAVTFRNARASQVDEAARWSFYKPLNTRFPRSSQLSCLVQDSLPPKKPSDSSGGLKCSPKSVFPVLHPTLTERRLSPGRDTAEAEWLPQRAENTTHTRSVMDESTPTRREVPIDDLEFPFQDLPQDPDATIVVRQVITGMSKAKRQRIRRQMTRREAVVRKQLETRPTVEEEFIEDAEARSQCFPNPTGTLRRTVQHIATRTSWLSQKTDEVRNEMRVMERLSPPPEEELVDDSKAPPQVSPEHPGTTGVEQPAWLLGEEVLKLRAKRRNKAKKQRMSAQRRRKPATAWKQLETIEEELDNNGRQLGIIERRIETWRQLEVAKVQLEICGIELEIVESSIRASRLLCTVEEQLALVDRRLDMVRRQKEVWTQLDIVEHKLCVVERWLEIINRRVEICTHLDMVEHELYTVEIQLEVVDRRIKAWKQLEIAETQLELVGTQLETAEIRLDLIRTGSRVVDGPGLGLREFLLLIEGASDNTMQTVSDPLLKRTIMSSTTRTRRYARRQRRSRKMATWPSMEQATRQRQSPRRPAARPLSEPSSLLAGWLDTKDVSEREEFWLKNRVHYPLSSLPLILVLYLRRSANPEFPLDEFDQSCLKASTANLHCRGFTVKDVAEWAWIISSQDPKAMIERFTSTVSKKPIFVILEILRRDVPDIRSLKRLLVHCWNQLLGRPGSNLITMSEVEIESMIPWSKASPMYAHPARPSIQHLQSETTSFFLMFSGLLYQARRLWPPAIVSISHMVAPFIDLQLGSGTSEPRELDNATHWRLCSLFNQMLHVLALPASISPFKSMVHNWHAQRVLLEMTSHFKPPLLLDQNSYRAVAKILAASKKSERESRAAGLRRRSWPPWRVEQDGMDAQRSPEDDLSRVVAIATQAKESGYSEDVRDQALRVLGGQEPDGTPTIPTRKLVHRRVRRRRGSTESIQEDPGARIWAARIESTRDVQEAWSAFVGYQEQGRQPTMSMYFAMIAKIQFEGARSGRLIQHSATPGDGKEVLQPSNDNFSIFYRTRLQPPTVDELYRQMRLARIRPSGRFLIFLIQHARTPNQAIEIMSDGGINLEALDILKGSKGRSVEVLKRVPDSIFAAYITLLCRFAPRAILMPPRDEPGAVNGDGPTQSEWKVLEMRAGPSLCRRGPDILLRTVELLKKKQTRFRPAWYAFFSALARRGVVVDRSLVGHPKNDILAWKVLAAALNDFHKCGLELDPRGFQVLCNGIEKAIMASFKIPEKEREEIFDNSQISIVVDEFMKLSEADETSHPMIPTLLHTIEGVHLHAYVRVLGLAEDYDAMMYALRWMVKHNVVLDDIATQSQNGSKLIKRTIVAIKVFLGRTEHEAEAEELVNSVEQWGGWPQDSEAQKYINRGLGCTDRDGSDDGDDGEP